MPLKTTSYWPTISPLKFSLAIGNLVCVLAFHWSFVLYDLIFYWHYKEFQIFYLLKIASSFEGYDLLFTDKKDKN